MATAVVTKTLYNAPYGLDLTATRTYEHGLLSFAAGNYVAGGLLPNWNVATSVFGPFQDASAQNVVVGHYTQPASFTITNIALTSNVVTVTAKHSLVAGQWVTFSGLTTAPFLNGLTLQVASVSTTVSFTVAFTHANVGSAAETGNAVQIIGPDTLWLQSISGSGWIYGYNKANGTIQIFTVDAAVVSTQYALIELAAGALPSTVVSDIVEFEAEWVRA